jgi:two-component system cell cycle response regulator
MTVPEATLFRPISRAARTLPWLFLAAFALDAALLVVFLVRNREARAHADFVARTDSLTGIGNRRVTEEELARLLADCRRHCTSLGVLIIDVDHFKAVNDRHGHGGGDIVLREVVNRVAGCLRINDLVGRWGGEEFIVLLPNTGTVKMAIVAERIRSHVAADPIAVKHATAAVTVSVGAPTATAIDDTDGVVDRADAALYTAKKTDRDRYVGPDLLQPFLTTDQ